MFSASTIKSDSITKKNNMNQQLLVVKQKQGQECFQYKYVFISLEAWKLCYFQVYLRCWQKQANNKKKTKKKTAIIKLLGNFRRVQNTLFYNINGWWLKFFWFLWRRKEKKNLRIVDYLNTKGRTEKVHKQNFYRIQVYTRLPKFRKIGP